MSNPDDLMVLENLAVPTGVIRPGAMMRDFLAECVRCKVPGLPYLNDQGEIVGRLSLRHSFKSRCIPHFLIDAAQVLGDDIHEVDMSRERVQAFLNEPVERHLLKPMARTSSRSSLTKGLAIMEKFNTSYIFLIDDDLYKGIVTHLEIAQRLLERVGLSEEPQP